MRGKLSGWEDTIVALATPPGLGAIGVIRLSGKDALPVVQKLFSGKDLENCPSHTLHVGWLRLDGKELDEVVIGLFRAPKSYTGEDVVEISCHGSPFVLEQVLQACLKAGARLARAGEFTQRAFLNGKLDLAQAESVADLIASNSEASRNAAIHHMRGGFSQDLKKLREQLLSFSALIELELDFSQEDVEFADRKQFYGLLESAQQLTNELLQSFQWGNVIRNGIQVAIIGKPNAGKSTLLNALLKEERAIVSEVPGTTRDTVEEVLNIDGILFRLIDTAGIRQHTDDFIETLGMERSLQKMQSADVVFYLFDSGKEDAADLEKELRVWESRMGLNEEEVKVIRQKIIYLGNKSDQMVLPSNTQDPVQGIAVHYLSAKTGKGIAELKQLLVQKVISRQLAPESTIVTNARHFQALQEVSAAIKDIQTGLDRKLSGDLLSTDIHRCLHWLGEITGEITSEHQLDYIFSKFCIGK